MLILNFPPVHTQNCSSRPCYEVWSRYQLNVFLAVHMRIVLFWTWFVAINELSYWPCQPPLRAVCVQTVQDMNHSGRHNGQSRCYSPVQQYMCISLIFQSSLDRGCFSCECLLIPENEEGLHFWKRRLGHQKVESILQSQARGQKGQELFIELSKNEMRTFYDQTALPHQEIMLMKTN